MNKACFLKRRNALIEKMGRDGIAVFPAAPDADERHIYRQDADFYYLTGFEEPESVAVLYQDGSGSQFVLLNRPEDIQAAVWTGRLAGQTDACSLYGANHSYPMNQLEEILLMLFEGKQKIYYPMGRYPEFDRMMMTLMNKMKSKQRAGSCFPSGWMNSEVLTHDLRLVKDEQEIEYMRKAAKMSAYAHREIMKLCRPGIYEYELKSYLLSEFIRHGAAEEAYPAIVGGGRNACVLHYNQNRDLLQAGDLVLVDAGASYQYYAADVTRTFPVNGRFTREQASIYQLVLEAQLAVIEYIKPGIRFAELQSIAVKVLTEGLVTLGFLKGPLLQLIETKAYSAFFMHGVSHWLGIDVHDVGDYKVAGESRVLKAGMVLTVEPGLYLSEERLDLATEWKNIGVRIEDDVLVTETGCEVLSQDAPKTIQEIEALRS